MKAIEKLGVILNEVKRIVLGCQHYTRIEIMRIELDLPSTEHTVKELVPATLRRGDSTVLYF